MRKWCGMEWDGVGSATRMAPGALVVIEPLGEGFLIRIGGARDV